MQDDATLADLVEVSGLHVKTVEKTMRVFRSHGIVHISDYIQDAYGRDAFIVYRLGEGKDKKKFRIPDAERTRRCKLRKKMLNLHPTSLLTVSQS